MNFNSAWLFMSFWGLRVTLQMPSVPVSVQIVLEAIWAAWAWCGDNPPRVQVIVPSSDPTIMAGYRAPGGSKSFSSATHALLVQYLVTCRFQAWRRVRARDSLHRSRTGHCCFFSLLVESCLVPVRMRISKFDLWCTPTYAAVCSFWSLCCHKEANR